MTVVRIKIDEHAPSACQSREFIDLNFSVEGNSSPGRAGLVRWVPSMSGHQARSREIVMPVIPVTVWAKHAPQAGRALHVHSTLT